MATFIDTAYIRYNSTLPGMFWILFIYVYVLEFITKYLWFKSGWNSPVSVEIRKQDAYLYHLKNLCV